MRLRLALAGLLCLRERDRIYLGFFLPNAITGAPVAGGLAGATPSPFVTTSAVISLKFLSCWRVAVSGL